MKVETKRYLRNAFIYLDGKFDFHNFFIVKSGKIKILKTNSVFGNSDEIKGEGYIFGIIQCITGIKDEESVMALTDCEILIIQRDQIENLYKDHPKIILKIISEYSEILRNLDKELIKIDFYYSALERSSKVFSIANQYFSLNEVKKAAHLLKSFSTEPDISQSDKSKAIEALNKLPNVDVISLSADQIICDKTFEPGEVIFTELEVGNTFYIIKKGKVRISKLRDNEEALIAVLNSGDIFGEMAIINDKPRNATAVAEERTYAMIIDKKSISNLPPSLFVKILIFLTRRIWLVQQQIISNSLATPVSQIYYYLVSKLRLAGFDYKRDYEKTYSFNFPIKELYQVLGINARKSNDALQDFIKDKNLEFFDNYIKAKKIGLVFDKNIYLLSRSDR